MLLWRALVSGRCRYAGRPGTVTLGKGSVRTGCPPASCMPQLPLPSNRIAAVRVCSRSSRRLLVVYAAVYTTSMGQLTSTMRHPAEIGILLSNNQRQHRTLHIQKDMLRYTLC